MRVRTFVGILVALAVVVFVSYLSQHNLALLTAQFRLGETWSVPLYAVFVLVFLAGFLPVVSILLVQTLKRDLAQRRERRLSREAKSVRGSFRRAVDFQADGQWARAAAEFEALQSDQGEDFGTLVRHGEVLRHQGLSRQALEIHRRASVLYPQSVAILYELAEDYEALGEREVAHQIRDRILRDFPGHGLRILRLRRNAALGAADWEEAVRLQEKIDALAAEAGDGSELQREEGVRLGLAYQRGVGLLEGDRFAEAEEEMRRIVEREPRFLPAALMLGEAAAQQDRPEDAVAAWRRGFESSGSPVFLQRIEDHFIERGEPMQALETLHAMIASAENDLLPRFFLGRLYYRLEMHAEALKVLQGLADRIGNSPTYHYLLARIRQRRGEMVKAVESYLACVQEAGIPASEYGCRVCRTTFTAWQDRCEVCGSWNSVEMQFEEADLSAEELGVRPGPVWSVSGGGADSSASGKG